ncbi:MAG: T9SS type A sorting domain-containing protein [Bacteroidetes bacterium]|nr:T9SS type A sorting domain-containing protein [Bacteroidota bacterium]
MKAIKALLPLLVFFTSTVYNAQAQNQQCLSESWIDVGQSLPSNSPVWLLEQSKGDLYALILKLNVSQWQLYRYDGYTWTYLSILPIAGYPIDMVSYKGELYIIGYFGPLSGSLPGSTDIVKWNGSKWAGVGNDSVLNALDLHVHKGQLFVTGSFNHIGAISANNIAMYDGTSWHALAAGLLGGGNTNPSCMESYQGDLIVGGTFTLAGGTNVKNLAKWNGSSWNNFPSNPNSAVKKMVFYNGELFVFGAGITEFGGNFFNVMASWDGNNWKTTNIANYPTDLLSGFEAFEVYNGELYALNNMGNNHIGNEPVEGFLKWDGTHWQIITGAAGWGYDMIVHKTHLYVAGDYSYSCGTTLSGLIRMCDFSRCGTVSGTVFVDVNGNCIRDTGDSGIEDKLITILPSGIYITTDDSGRFTSMLDSGIQYINSPNPPKYHNLICPSSSYTINIVQGNTYNNKNFAFQPIPNIQDLEIILTSMNAPRPGFDFTYHIKYKNIGTTTMTGTVGLVHDNILIYKSATIAYSNYSGNTMTWNYSNLAPLKSKEIKVTFTLPVNATLGDHVISTATIYPTTNEEDVENNESIEDDIIVGSYDPNDKQVSPGGNDPAGKIHHLTDKLTYTIRFQNTGTDTAFNIKIKDQIDSNLILSTIKTIASSHPYKMYIQSNRWITWEFENVLLPDSFANEPESHGFIKYTIEPKENLPLNTMVKNMAEIYFDFNTAVLTDTISSTFVSGINDFYNVNTLETMIYPDPFSDIAYLVINRTLKNGAFTLYDIHGREVRKIESIHSDRITITRENLRNGIYIYELIDKDGSVARGKFVVQ